MAVKKVKPDDTSATEQSTDRAPTADASETPALIRMRLDAPALDGYTGPTTANVHQAEVGGWQAGGWVIDQEQPSEGDDAKTTGSTAATAEDASSTIAAAGNVANGLSSDAVEG